MRNIPQAIVDAAQTYEGSYRVDFAKLDLVDTDGNPDPLRLSTLFKDIELHGDGLYTGAGMLLDISELSESLEAKQNSIVITLNGIDEPGIIGTLTDTAVIGSQITLRRGYFNEATGGLVHAAGDINDNTFIIWKGLVNDYATTYGGSLGQENNVVISVTAKNLLVSILESKSGRFTSPQSFAQHNSSDKSMEFVPSLVSFNPRFGREE